MLGTRSLLRGILPQANNDRRSRICYGQRLLVRLNRYCRYTARDLPPITGPQRVPELTARHGNTGTDTTCPAPTPVIFTTRSSRMSAHRDWAEQDLGRMKLE